MKKGKWIKRINGLVFGGLLILILTVSLQPKEAQAATKSIKAGNFDTVSVYDMNSSGFQKLALVSSNKEVKVRKKTYTDNGVKHTAVLAWAPYSLGEDETATVTIKYYDTRKRKNVSVKKQVSFLADYNGGYEAEQAIEINSSRTFRMKGTVKLESIYSSLDRYESSMFAPFSGGGDGSESCTVVTSKKDKTFRILADEPGMMGCYVAGYYINGEISVYRFTIIVPSKEGNVFTQELKLVKDRSTVLYFTPAESGRLSVQISDQEIATAKIMENQDTKEAALILTGLKAGETSVNLSYDENGKTITNHYVLQVIEESPVKDEILLTPTEEEQSYSCIYPLTDGSGNLLKAITGRDYMEIVLDSKEVSVEYYTWDKVNLRVSKPGTYHISVRLKDLEGKTVEEYTLTVTAGELKYSNTEEIIFTNEADAKAYFCGKEYGSWISGEYTIGFQKNDVITAIWASNPWFLKSGDYAPGDATYSFDLKQQKIIVKDYDRTIEIPYEVIAKNHVRLTINGKTLDFINNSEK